MSRHLLLCHSSRRWKSSSLLYARCWLLLSVCTELLLVLLSQKVTPVSRKVEVYISLDLQQLNPVSMFGNHRVTTKYHLQSISIFSHFSPPDFLITWHSKKVHCWNLYQSVFTHANEQTLLMVIGYWFVEQVSAFVTLLLLLWKISHSLRETCIVKRLRM